MTRKIVWIPNALGLLLLLTLLPTLVAWAQTVVELPADYSDWTQWLPVLVAVIAPALLGLLKKMLFREQQLEDGSVIVTLPAWFPKWLPLVLAPALVWLSDLLLQFLAGSPGLSPWVLVLLSSMPTYIREVADQLKRVYRGDSDQVVELLLPKR